MTLLTSLHYYLQFFTRPVQEKKMILRSCILSHEQKPETRILDFGCGEGIFSDIVADQKQMTYIGVDRNYASIRYAKKNNPANFYCVGNEQLCLPAKHCDFIILNYVLHHLKPHSFDYLIKEIKRVLSANSYIIILELIPRRQQKGLFFKAVTYLEERIKKIIYIDEAVLEEYFSPEYKRIKTEQIGHNTRLYLFTNV